MCLHLFQFITFIKSLISIVHIDKTINDTRLRNALFNPLVIDAKNFGSRITLHLVPNIKIIDPHFLVLKRNANVTAFVANGNWKSNCFYKSTSSPYFATVDICDGIKGVITSNWTEFYTISPLPKRLWNESSSIPHVLMKLNSDANLPYSEYKRNYKSRVKKRSTRYWNRLSNNPEKNLSNPVYKCGNTYINKPVQVSYNGTRYKRDNNMPKKDIYIETAVFIDRDLFRHMVTNFPADTENELIRFVLALINAVELLYHDPSLGWTVNFVLKRLEILHVDPPGLQRSHDIDKFLSNFCTWQHNENPVGDEDPLHWDHAVILTGLDLYVMNKNGKLSSQVVGLAPVAGMCTATSSCTVNEGRHFESAFVVAHEIGHNLGMRHDGVSSDNTCDPSGYLMSPTLGSGKITWSSCSKRYLERFLESKQSRCLIDTGTITDLLDHGANGVLPGERFDAHQQCKLKYGSNSQHALTQPLDEVCKDLHCSRDKYTWTSHPALEGTICGRNKWCRSGRCIERGLSLAEAGYAPHQVVNGGWSSWSPYTDCASSCLYGDAGGLTAGSTGIMIAFRRCNNPRPENGGEKCSGNDQKFKTCTAFQCHKVKKITLIDFANELCNRASEIDSELSTNGNQRTSNDPEEACSVWCHKKNGGYKSRGWSYPDGTVCQMNHAPSKSTFCIKGICRQFTCDRNIDSNYLHSDEFCPQALMKPSVQMTTTISPVVTAPINRDKRKGMIMIGQWMSSSECFYNCISPGSGIRLVERKKCDSCNATINVQMCKQPTQICGKIKTVAEHATAVCSKYSERVRRLSGMGMQLSSTADDLHRPCRLACQDESISHRFYLVNGQDGWFPFGTDCTRGDTTRNAYCINGKCLEFGDDYTPIYDFTYNLPLLSRIRRSIPQRNNPMQSQVDPSIISTLQDIIYYLKHGQYINNRMENNGKFTLDLQNPIHVEKEEINLKHY